MKTYTKIMTVSLGFILLVSEAANARSGEMPLSNDRATGVGHHYADSGDPLNDWLERNAERLGLYMDPQPSPPGKFETSASLPARPLEVPKPVAGSPHSEGPAPLRLQTSPDALEELFLKSVRDGTAAETQKRTSEPYDAAIHGTAGKRVAAKMSELLNTVLDTRNACDDFISEDGLGEFGTIVYKEVLKPENKETLDGPRDVRSERLCPNYDNLSASSRAYFWVYVKAAQSFFEGSCHPLSGSGKTVVENGKVRVFKRVKGPNGFARGLFALHEGKEDTYGAENCEKGDAKSGKRSTICNVSMITAQIKRRFDLFSRDTHFGVFRPQGDVIRKKDGSKARVQISRSIVTAIRALPFCGYKGRNATEERRTLSASKAGTSASAPITTGTKTYAPAGKTRRSRETYR